MYIYKNFVLILYCLSSHEGFAVFQGAPHAFSMRGDLNIKNHLQMFIAYIIHSFIHLCRPPSALKRYWSRSRATMRPWRFWVPCTHSRMMVKNSVLLRWVRLYLSFIIPVASFTKEVNPWLAKRPLKTNGRLANLKLVEWGGVRKFLLPYVNAVWGSTA